MRELSRRRRRGAVRVVSQGRWRRREPAPARILQPRADDRVALPAVSRGGSMKISRKQIALAAIALVVALAALALAAYLVLPMVATPTRPGGEHVPATYREVQASAGHVAHV